MIPKSCKRLAEVDFPIAVVSAHSAREKSIRHGHPSTLHLWWARRPLAACRAMLLALLLPDPCDPNCPQAFKDNARELLAKVQGRPGPSDLDLRKELLRFIGDFSNWDLAAKQPYLEVGRGLVKAAHGDETPLVVDPFAGGGSIPLEALRLGCDAFASDLNPVACLILKVMLEDIPRHGRELADELRRVGAEIKKQAEKELAQYYPADPDLPAPRRAAFFVYVLKCADDSFYIGQTDDIPRRLAEHESGEVSWTAPRRPLEIIHWETFDSREGAVKREQDLKTGFGRKWLKREYEAGRLAARQAGGAVPIADLWARTVKCESPNCGAEIPLVRSFWLCQKASRLRALRYEVKRPKGKAPHIEFEVFTPKSEKEVPRGTVARGNATCPVCERVLPVERVRVQLREQRGGADTIFDANGDRIGGARLLAVVTLHDDKAGRQYRVATERDYEAVWKAQRAFTKLTNEKLPNGLSVIPDEPTPPQQGHRATASARVYGIDRWVCVFTARQTKLLATLAALIRSSTASPAAKALAALSFDRLVMQGSAHCRWKATGPSLVDMFGRHTIGMEWSFAESAPIVAASDVFHSWLCQFAAIVEKMSHLRLRSSNVSMADACDHPLPSAAAEVWCTDPPYYDAVPYAYLADCFYVWIKRLGLHSSGYQFFSSITSPTDTECVADYPRGVRGIGRNAKFFEERIALAAAEGRRVLRADGVGCVVFAHRTTEGWESLLSGLVKAGWSVTASWPVATELSSRLNARETASLATSVHLVCRPRPEDAPIGDWAEAFRELPDRIGDWMERLSSEGVRGADLVFACIGPAMEIYSRYRRVEDAEGREIPLGGDPEATAPYQRGFLAYVWEIVGRTALQQVLGTAEARARNGAAGALEEDARLTALFLWTHQSTSPNGASNGAGKEAPEDEGAETVDEDDDEAPTGASKKGLTLIYDVVRRFSQPLGIHLDTWNGRIIETKKGIVRLLPVKERAEHLLGEDGASGIADVIERSRGGPVQFSLLGDNKPWDTPRRRSGGRKSAKSTPDEAPALAPGTTTLDRVHIAMLLQASGKSNALRTMLKAEQDRGPDFLRLANALSALYPRDSEEKRLLDAMLLAAPR